MGSLSDYLHDVAQQCRFWSRSTFDLTVAGALRHISEELDSKAAQCGGINCRDDKEAEFSPPDK
jgi:hypothetical protein